eukprot:gb/GECG01007591.1/.p1 GENE.gb/GECG01007591.1/~~gb/GECG01007591.1/.p1  ORF type:complete len:117 (+),score=8.19 gb/GECG01007591.1/:1-351(+)
MANRLCSCSGRAASKVEPGEEDGKPVALDIPSGVEGITERNVESVSSARPDNTRLHESNRVRRLTWQPGLAGVQRFGSPAPEDERNRLRRQIKKSWGERHLDAGELNHRGFPHVHP